MYFMKRETFTDHSKDERTEQKAELVISSKVRFIYHFLWQSHIYNIIQIFLSSLSYL